MLDSDLAILYGVTTGNLNLSVKRNHRRFPWDFMFQVTKKEYDSLILQNAISKSKGRGGTRKLPFAFTELGVSMLAGILKSTIAIQVHIQIVRVFAKMKEMLLLHKDILLQLEKIETKTNRHEAEIKLLFKHLKQLVNPDRSPGRRIGFRSSNEEKE